MEWSVFVGVPQQRPYLVSFYDDDIVLGFDAAEKPRESD